jgi:1A family penicillin-binding protein
MRNLVNKIKGKVRKVSKRTWKNYLILVFAVCIFLGGAFFVWISTFKIPTLDSFQERRVVESTKIYDNTGEILLYDVNQDIKRTVVPLEEISRNVKNATIAIEDREFYEHHGIKPKSFLRAVFANIFSLSFSQGGSTITQQVVKLSLLSTEKKISRKLKEWVLAVKLEDMLSKDEILSLYLNEIPYGGSVYGIEEASLAFLGKSASDLTIAESAYLASLPQAPTFYSPYGNNRERLEERKNIVLREMESNGFITKEEHAQAKAEIVEFKPKNTAGIQAPHFVFYVIEKLEEKYGEDVVQRGGLRIKTTLDKQLQDWGEEIAKTYALENETKFNAENAAFVAIDPKTGAILSMVGSRDYFDKEIDGNFNIATAHRQPGSTFKPFVYATAFNKGYTPETVLFDTRTQFSTRCGPDNLTSVPPCYAPDNYDNAYRGPMSLRNALAQSVNIPSVKVLYLAGINESIKLAEEMGIKSLGNSGQYGLTLVLGGGEVSLLDMTSAYGVFANEGVRNPYFSILEVKDKNGKILEEWKPTQRNVLLRETALRISDILSDNVARAPAFGESSFLHFGNQDVAVKTGTTNDYKDAWIIGYTPNVVLGSWAGNNDNTSMEKRVAGFIVAPMWRAYMDKILSTRDAEVFPSPAVEDSFELKPVLRGKWLGGISNLIDTVSGKNATIYTPKETTKEVLSGGVHTILYWLNKNEPRGARPLNPGEDSQFELWERGVERWMQSTGFVAPIELPLPTGDDTAHGPQFAPQVKITSPKNDSTYRPNEKINVIIESSNNYPLKEVRYFINGVFIGDSKNLPFVFSFTPNDLGLLESKNELSVIVYDSIYNQGEAKTSFTVSLP